LSLSFSLLERNRFSNQEPNTDIGSRVTSFIHERLEDLTGTQSSVQTVDSSSIFSLPPGFLNLATDNVRTGEKMQTHQ